MLEITGLRAAYGGGNDVLHDVSLKVRRGSIACLLGANGAGKSTTMRVACGLLKPRAGSIVCDGHELRQRSPERVVASGMVLVPEGRRVFAPLSVDENLQMGGYVLLRARRQKEYAQRLAFVHDLFPRLRERARQAAGTLSGGEQQMLAIGRALMSGPRMLLLDEPSMGLAPLVVRDIFATLARLRDEGLTLLIAEQNARAGLSVADDAFVITEGRITHADTAQALKDDPTLSAAYLGQAA